MKKLLIVIPFLILLSCNNNKKKPVIITAKDTTWLSDSAKELPPVAVARKKHPVPGTGGGGGTTIPPTSTSATNLILLDFDGGIVSGTSWNYNGDIAYAPSGLADSIIAAIIARVKQAFDSLNVIITIDESAYNATATNHRQKEIFTTTHHDWFGDGAAGTSFIGSFGSEQPCWVFTDLMKFSIRTRETACHEIGHALGCHHGVLDDGTCSRLRDLIIMGYVYNTPINSWTTGLNDNCQFQNDLQTMASMVGWKQ